jgi:ATP-dependent helicase/DNAse subunit B
MSYEEKVEQIFETFGYAKQRRKLAEEVDEFNDEVLLFEKGIGDIEKVEEEFRDINVVLDGFREFYEILKELDQEYKEFKVDRTLDRIENGYYKTC